ncbi:MULTISPECIES: hypothetical protein [unclassified Paenibacillus]|uniref:hypothetical protein n=2 Tax=Paenibacillus TaxID=44249 RepID=UPI0008C53586|nr:MULTISPECIES: hypothetical protein [unclassified Paenibacillus]QLG42071.1 hypothetical protein HW560_30775 [Paenibacillus sp. E222]SEM94797.1 hypothetical protein SAMN05518670_0666 [Paenibacillus sp. OK076]
MINKILVENMKSKYVKEAHPIIYVDGKPLDHILNELYPDDLFLGLIPTIVDWMSVDEESNIVENTFNATDEVKIVPILMCPDDCDLSCSLIVAEVETTLDQVRWNRIGIDLNNPKDLINRNEFLETGVKWLDKVPKMTFLNEDYKTLEKIYKKS